MIGKVFGNRYELIEKVGTGGMAIVYKAKCKLLNRFVAVKVLKEEFKTDEAFLEKFSKEAQSAAGLSHPNIVNIYDVGKEDDVPYIVMEYVPGDTLKAYISSQKGFLKNDQIANFSRQIALALEHAHSNQIIHRDIKPHNILVAPDGTLKVADFGIASAVSETTTSYTGEAIGSIKYTSPEQARGRHVDQRTDLYSLGILMYEMATRQVPFMGETAVEIALKHMRDDVTTPMEINTTFHRGLESIVMRSLLKDISQRYQNARELIDDLEKIINNPSENVAFYDFDSDAPTQKIPSLNEFDLVEEGETRKMKNKTSVQGQKKGLKNHKIMKFLPIIGVVLLGFLTALMVFVFVRLGNKPREVEPDYILLPSVVGETYEDAKKILEDQGFLVIKGGSEKSNQVAAGSVSSQDPRTGQKLKYGFLVTLNISGGATTDSVPNLGFKTLSEAEVMVSNSKFSLGEVTYVNNDLAKGIIISQEPEAGMDVNDDSLIMLTVSLGPENNQVVVPRLTNLTLKDSQKRLIELGLDVGEIEYEEHVSIEKESIISQSIAEGTEVELGSLIDIVVSSGKEEEEEEEDPNGNSTKAFNFPAGDYMGQTVKVTVFFERDGEVLSLYNKTHTITEEASVILIEVTASGSGVLNFFIKDQLVNSRAVDF